MSRMVVRRMDQGRDMAPFTDFDRFFDQAFPGWFGGNVGMPVDLSETEDAYIVEVDAPGVAKDDLELTLERNHLTISVNASAETENNDRKVLRKERQRLHASRTIRFSHAIDADAVTATFHDGVLVVTAPKLASEKARRISIG
jgi:HSP20 family protein